MAKKIAPLLPSTEELLCQFGDRLHVARLRRRLSAKQVAERAGMSPMTLRSLERGGSGVTMGAYLSVMQVLGIEQDLNLLGKSDPIGRELQDSQLPGRTKTKKSSLSAALKTPATSKLPPSVGDAAAELRRVIKNSPTEQMRKLLNSMPSEQIRQAIEARPVTQVRKALAAIPSVHLRESIGRKNAPPKEIKKMLKRSEDAQDWIKKSGFASSEALSGLIDPGVSLKKTRG